MGCLSMTMNVTDLPLEVISDLGEAVLFLKAIGVAALVYFVYMIVAAVLNYKKLKRLGVIEKKVDLVEKKLDRVLKKRG
jgi:hypothetical protein